MMIAQKYRKKPVVIDAILWDGSVAAAEVVMAWLAAFWGKEGSPPDKEGLVVNSAELVIPTLEGLMTAKRGDYIVKGVQGEVYPCRPDIFDQTYDPC